MKLSTGTTIPIKGEHKALIVAELSRLNNLKEIRDSLEIRIAKDRVRLHKTVQELYPELEGNDFEIYLTHGIFRVDNSLEEDLEQAFESEGPTLTCTNRKGEDNE